jgi:general secretion pathway protein G
MREGANGRKVGTMSKEEGYTLMELLVVIAILGLLMVVVTPQIMRQFSKAKYDTAALQVETLVSALEIYYIDIGDYPSAENGLRALVSNLSTSERWNGPYVRKRKSLIDPWGEPFIYKGAKGGALYEILSYGADKVEGGAGDDRDVSSEDDIL